MEQKKNDLTLLRRVDAHGSAVLTFLSICGFAKSVYWLDSVKTLFCVYGLKKNILCDEKEC